MHHFLFEKALLKALPQLAQAKIIAAHKTRLGGDIVHLITSQGEAFVKMGTGYERLEIIREQQNLSSLYGYLPVPKIYGYIHTANWAALVLEKMPGQSLHHRISSLGRQSFLLLIKNILDELYKVPQLVRESLEIGLYPEFKDINSLIDKDKIRQESFMEAAQRLSPKQAFDKLQGEVKNHTTYALSHGDFCLPNILVTTKGKWSLIDWEKADKEIPAAICLP